MILLEFIKRTERRDLRRMLALTVIAGFANAVLVVIVNRVAGLVAEGDRPGLWLWLVFVGAFVLYYLCDRISLLMSNRTIEGLLRDLRVEIAAKLRRTELPTVDALGRGDLYNMVSQETNHLSVSFPLLMESFQQAVLMVASLLYLGYLSISALLVFLLAIGLGIFGYLRINASFRATLAELGRCQANMLDAVGDIIDGAKEIRLNNRRNDAVFAAYSKLSEIGQRLMTRSGEHWAALVLLSGIVIYFILGVVGFVFPIYISGHNTIVFQLVPTLLFCIGPMTRIVAQSPMFLRAEVGLSTVMDVLRRLDAAPGVDPQTARNQAAAFRNFTRIAYRGLVFSYLGKSGGREFSLGPLDLEVQRGELLFIVGGNGSGKSTMLRLMTALYPRAGGEIEVDGGTLDAAQVAGFRELFSAVFADFHLFDRLYGIEDIDPERVNRLIKDMGLAGKLKFEDGRFTDLNLSTGQRKRLALIAALLEDRPIYIFDEWSAEQDVHFREYFYTRVLPDLQARGKTVIAVTHDDLFWHVADRVVKLDLGRVEWVKSGKELEAKS